VGFGSDIVSSAILIELIGNYYLVPICKPKLQKSCPSSIPQDNEPKDIKAIGPKSCVLSYFRFHIFLFLEGKDY